MTKKCKELIGKFVCTTALLSFTLSLSTASAQVAFLNTGGTASGNGGKASYSVGLIFYRPATGTGGSANEGIQQPYEIYTPGGIEEGTGITLQCMAMPNPVTDNLTLKIENFKPGNLSYRLYDLSGKILENRKIQSNESVICMGNLVSSIYFLNIFLDNREIKTFKIIKK